MSGNRHPLPAAWRPRLPWLVALGLALIPLICTAVGSAIGQVLDLPNAAAMLVIAAAVTVSATIGLLIARAAAPGLRGFGFRAPASQPLPALLIIPALTVIITVAAGGGFAPLPTIAAAVVLCAVVAVNEELFFRGLVLGALSRYGARVAVSGSAGFFAVLHLGSLAGGASPLYAALQLVFAALFGIVAGELACLTGSLWPTIAWHFAYDLASYATGDALTPLSLTGIGVNCAALAILAVILWRRLPRRTVDA
ncbi:CPBP family intramembrane glutamic endopeptidase [Microbacterium gorillae]|uniref:CPBP family intramembrane glutamic endopeptidase n=1 Tax=Microbacterium gorillae TaxID=1231063 RepID=UPI00058C1938|nr:CPBP family intramembrane glutamic endopeptidase [Microbacterium gorillae]